MKNKKILPSVKGNDFSQKKNILSLLEFVWSEIGVCERVYGAGEGKERWNHEI